MCNAMKMLRNIQMLICWKKWHRKGHFAFEEGAKRMGDLRQVIGSEILPAKSCFHQQREKGKRRGYGGGWDVTLAACITSPHPHLC